MGPCNRWGKQVSFAWDAQKPPALFENLELSVHGGSRVAVVGRNGGGKSTLLRLIHGGLLPTQGEVSRDRRCTVRSHSAPSLALSAVRTELQGTYGRTVLMGGACDL